MTALELYKLLRGRLRVRTRELPSTHFTLTLSSEWFGARPDASTRLGGICRIMFSLSYCQKAPCGAI